MTAEDLKRFAADLQQLKPEVRLRECTGQRQKEGA